MWILKWEMWPCLWSQIILTWGWWMSALNHWLFEVSLVSSTSFPFALKASELANVWATEWQQQFNHFDAKQQILSFRTYIWNSESFFSANRVLYTRLFLKLNLVIYLLVSCILIISGMLVQRTQQIWIFLNSFCRTLAASPGTQEFLGTHFVQQCFIQKLF